MQLSSFYCQGENYPYCITFMNNMDGKFKVIIAELDDDFDWLYDGGIKSFIITYDEICKSKNLYKTYIVSLLATADPLKYHYNANGYSQNLGPFINNDYYVQTRKLYDGLYFDKIYSEAFGFNHLPFTMTIDDEESNDEIKKYFMQRFDNDKEYIISYINTEIVDSFILNNMERYLERYTDYIECDIANMENNQFYIKKYKMFVDKICKHKNIVDDMKLFILQKICIPDFNDPLMLISNEFDDDI